MYESISIIGRLGKDPTMKFTPKGVAITEFSVAVDVYNRDKPKWFKVTVFGDQAESCNQYLSKGSPVLVVGTMNDDPETGGPRLWEGKDGVTRGQFEIKAYTVRFLPSGEKREEKQVPKEVPW